MKKKILLLLTCVLTTVYGFTQSGTCGDNLTWVLDNGTLTISGVGEMTDYDYDNDSPWCYNYNIIYVEIENGVTTISRFAFYYCRNLKSINIPKSLISIGEDAFGNCISLTSIEVDNANSFFSSENGILFDKSKTELILCPMGKSGSYTIPEGVTSIGDGAFSGCIGLTSVTIPDGLTSIGYSAFSNCSGLISITIPASLTSIKIYAFAFCKSLTSIEVDNTNSFYLSENGILFDKAKKVLIQYPAGKSGSYTIPEGVTSIGDGAFSGCIGLTSITIPEGVTSIGDGAFTGCSNLLNVDMPESITYVGPNAFYSAIPWYKNLPDGCIYMGKVLYRYKGTMPENTVIEIKEGTVSLSYHAFNLEGVNLVSVTIPASVTDIGPLAFAGCTNLKSIRVSWEYPIAVEQSTFSYVSISDVLLYIPVGTGDAYRSAEVWQDFNIIEGPNVIQNVKGSINRLSIYPNPSFGNFYISGIEENMLVTILDINGKIVSQQTVSPNESVSANHLSKGMYFVRAKGRVLKMIKL